MEECIFGHANLDPKDISEGDWTERQYDQLKNQIKAYRYLIENKPVPSDVVNNIRSYSPIDWEKRRIEKIIQIQQRFKEKFENQDFTMKELGLYFKQRNKEEENSIISIGPQTNMKEELEYNVDYQIDYKKNQIESYLLHIEQNSKNEELIQQLKKELKILKIYPLQKRLRKEIISPLIQEIDRSNTINLMDSLLFRMPLDRKYYKKSVQQFKKEKLNDKFEQQLRCGYDMRKKAKQKQFLNQMAEAQKIFMDMKKEKMNKLKKRVNMCKNSIESLEIKDKKERDRKERERIQYLKQNNMEEYLKMLNDAKDSRLKEFMNQTDQFIDEIKGKINIQKEIIKDTKKTSEDMEIEEKKEEKEDNNENNKEEKKDKTGANYYQTAHCKQEDIEEQPKMLKYGTLKSYQIKGLQWLVSLYVNNLNGILADEMGLGKTIQTIALLCYIMEKKNNDGPFLIIAPLATISNWVIEFQRWAPDIKIVVYKGAPAERRQMAFQIKQDKHKYNVVLTTYEYIMKDKYALNKVTWQYIIVDEGHRMKNYKSKFTQTLGTQFNSVYRLLLTGTPLQNNLSELWALLNFLLPKIFNSCDDFEKWFNQPFSSKLPGEKNTELTEEQELLIIHRLHNILRPFLLRREKKEVEKELPSKTEYVIKLQISDWQKIVYEQIKEQGLLAEDPTTGKLGRKALLNTMMQLRKVCNHPYIFFDLNNVMLEYNEDWIIKTSGKFEFLDRIIPKLLYFKHKILIFSQMTNLLTILERYLIYKGLKYLRLDGTTKSEERARIIELFSRNDDEYMIFILSTRAGGLGLNLQSADTVIIFDSDWNPQMDIQAQDRAHRIGQKHEVKVFRLISKNTVEEGILEKAAFKKGMDDKVIGAGLYNQNFSELERKNKLMDILKNENKGEEEEDEILNDEQINEDIARNEEEFNKFQEMDQERYLREKKEERLKQIQEKLNLTDEQMKNVNYRLLQEYEVPDWVKITDEKEKEIEKIEHVEIGGKEMRVRKHVNYNEDYDGDFLDGSISEVSHLQKKRKKDNSLSGFDSFEQENSRSNKKKKYGSESNSLRQNSQVDLYNLGEGSSKNNNVNINLGGGNKVQIHLNDDEDDDEIEQGENTIKSEDKIHIDEDEEDKENE